MGVGRTFSQEGGGNCEFSQGLVKKLPTGVKTGEILLFPLICIVSNLEKISKMSMLLPLKIFLRMPMLSVDQTTRNSSLTTGSPPKHFENHCFKWRCLAAVVSVSFLFTPLHDMKLWRVCVTVSVTTVKCSSVRMVDRSALFCTSWCDTSLLIFIFSAVYFHLLEVRWSKLSSPDLNS